MLRVKPGVIVPWLPRRSKTEGGLRLPLLDLPSPFSPEEAPLSFIRRSAGELGSSLFPLFLFEPHTSSKPPNLLKTEPDALVAGESPWPPTSALALLVPLYSPELRGFAVDSSVLLVFSEPSLPPFCCHSSRCFEAIFFPYSYPPLDFHGLSHYSLLGL